MEPKKYLQQYRASIVRTKEIADNLSELKAEAEALKNHEGQRVKLDDAVSKYIDACEEAASELERLEALRIDIMHLIDDVTDERMHSVLWRRYISGFTWEQIAVSMNYTYRRVTQIHGDALIKVGEMLAVGERKPSQTAS